MNPESPPVRMTGPYARMDLTPLQKYIQRFSSDCHRLYVLKVVLPGFRHCATCGRERKIANLHAMVAPKDSYLLVAVCDECDQTNKVDTTLLSQYDPQGVTHVDDDPEAWERTEQLLEKIRQETGLHYFNHPTEWGALQNGGPAYQSPTARAYLEQADGRG